MNKTVAVFVAMKFEIPNILLQSKDKIVKINNNNVITTISGISQQYTKSVVERICYQSSPDILIKLGFCGAVDKNLRRSDLVVVNEIRYKRKKISTSFDKCHAAIATFNKLGCHLGKMQTVDQLAISQKGIYPDISAVDMEAFVVAKVGSEFNIPVVVIKAVSDIIPERFSFLALLYNIIAITNSCKIGKNKLNLFMHEFLSIYQ